MPEWCPLLESWLPPPAASHLLVKLTIKTSKSGISCDSSSTFTHTLAKFSYLCDCLPPERTQTFPALFLDGIVVIWMCLCLLVGGCVLLFVNLFMLKDTCKTSALSWWKPSDEASSQTCISWCDFWCLLLKILSLLIIIFKFNVFLCNSSPTHKKSEKVDPTPVRFAWNLFLSRIRAQFFGNSWRRGGTTPSFLYIRKEMCF